MLVRIKKRMRTNKIPLRYKNKEMEYEQTIFDVMR